MRTVPHLRKLALLLTGAAVVACAATHSQVDPRFLAVHNAFAAMGLSLLGWLAATESWSLVLFALAFGAAYGGFVALMPALTTDYLGSRNTGAIIGLLYTGAGVGAFVGPIVAGAVYDARDSYTLPILLGVVMNAVAVACIVALPEPRTWAKAQLA